MEFRQINPDEIATIQGLCGIMVVTNGMFHYKELPGFGKTNVDITTHENKVTLIEENISKKTKL